MALRTHRWDELRSPEFRQLDLERTVAVLPVGAIEQHGPHLPVCVDACINAGVIARTLEVLDPELPVLVLPMTAVGKSDEHVDFPGTLTLSAETLAAVWTEYGRSVARAGVRKIVFINSHGGQPQVMQIVARRLRVEEKMLAVAANWFAWGVPEGMFPADEMRFGIHAGAVETSMMLALRPDLVDMDLARDFVPTNQRDAATRPRLGALGAAGFGWQAQDLHPAGAAGDATNADAGRGHAIIDHAARHIAGLLAEVSAWPLASLDTRPEW